MNRLRETSSIQDRPRSRNIMDLTVHVPVEDVQGYAITYQQPSVQNISKVCGYSESQVWNILSTYSAYPYHPTLGQELSPGDKECRFDFCNFILNK